MFFEEFVEQHRVYRVVAHGLHLAFVITSHQLRIHLFYFLGDESKHCGAIKFNLLFITEGDRLKRQNRFARFVHGLNLVLEPSRGDKRADLVVGIDVNCSARRDRGVNISDPSGVALASNPQDGRADADIAAARDTNASDIADGGVVVASYIDTERVIADGDVAVASYIATERVTAEGLVPPAGGIMIGAWVPVAVLKSPVVLLKSAKAPVDVLLPPVVLLKNAPAPVAVFASPVLLRSVPAPTPVLKFPSVSDLSDKKPTAVLYHRWCGSKVPFALLPC